MKKSKFRSYFLRLSIVLQNPFNFSLRWSYPVCSRTLLFLQINFRTSKTKTKKFSYSCKFCERNSNKLEIDWYCVNSFYYLSSNLKESYFEFASSVRLFCNTRVIHISSSLVLVFYCCLYEVLPTVSRNRLSCNISCILHSGNFLL